MDHSRRRLLAAAVTAIPAAACTTMVSGWPGETRIAPPTPVPGVRPPALGQEWTYRVRNIYNGLLIDEITERVAAVGPAVRIERVSAQDGALAPEVQSPWGMILEDPHWPLAIHFQAPIPLWPRRLEPQNSEMVDTRYGLRGDPVCDLWWQLSMQTIGWESVRVVAGQFQVLEYSNHIDFQSNDLSRFACERMEWIRFDPSIGRWVLRRSHGTYDFGDRGSDCYEDYLEWELVSWR